MRRQPFELVEPRHIRVGDLIMCFCHDDQWEARSARVVAILLDDTPGTYTFAGSDGFVYYYEYRVWLTCRHVNLKHLEATGGEPYLWHRFPWNRVARYILDHL